MYDSLNRGENWQAELDRMQVDAVVASFEYQRGLIEAMRPADGWELRIETSEYAYFVRR